MKEENTKNIIYINEQDLKEFSENREQEIDFYSFIKTKYGIDNDIQIRISKELSSRFKNIDFGNCEIYNSKIYIHNITFTELEKYIEFNRTNKKSLIDYLKDSLKIDTNTNIKFKFENQTIDGKKLDLENTDLNDIDFSNVTFEDVNVKTLNLQDSNFSDCSFEDVRVENIDLRGSYFNNSNDVAIVTKRAMLHSKEQDEMLRNLVDTGIKYEYDFCYSKFNKPGQSILRTLRVNISDLNLYLASAKDRDFSEFLRENKKIDDLNFIFDFSGLDLSDKNLSNAKFTNCNFADCNFKGANLEKASFKNSNFTLANFGGAIQYKFFGFDRGYNHTPNLKNAELNNCNFNKTNLNHADLSNSKIINSSFKATRLGRANLTNVKAKSNIFYDTHLRKAIIRDSDLSGNYFNNISLGGFESENFLTYFLDNILAKTTGINSNHIPQAERANLEDCHIVQSNLDLANLSNAKIDHSQISGTSVTRANLSEVSLKSANICRSDLSKIKAPNIDLSQAVITRTNVSRANLKGGNLEESHISNSNFKQSNLEAANLKNSTITSSDLSKCNLEIADLENSIVSADITLANFKGAKLKGTDLSKSKYKKFSLYSYSKDIANQALYTIQYVIPVDSKLIHTGLIKFSNFATNNINKLKAPTKAVSNYYISKTIAAKDKITQSLTKLLEFASSFKSYGPPNLTECNIEEAKSSELQKDLKEQKEIQKVKILPSILKKAKSGLEKLVNIPNDFKSIIPKVQDGIKDLAKNLLSKTIDFAQNQIKEKGLLSYLANSMTAALSIPIFWAAAGFLFPFSTIFSLGLSLIPAMFIGKMFGSSFFDVTKYLFEKTVNFGKDYISEKIKDKGTIYCISGLAALTFCTFGASTILGLLLPEAIATVGSIISFVPSIYLGNKFGSYVENKIYPEMAQEFIRNVQQHSQELPAELVKSTAWRDRESQRSKPAAHARTC